MSTSAGPVRTGSIPRGLKWPAAVVALSVAVIALLAAPRAEAHPLLLDCNRAERVLTHSNGDLTLLGRSSADCDPESDATASRFVLSRVSSDGSPDPRFGDGGIVTVPSRVGERALELLPASGGRAVVATDARLRSYREDGAPDPAFGNAGEASFTSPPLFEGQAGLAAAGHGGGYLVASTVPSVGAVVARFDGRGRIDESFAGDGVAEIPIHATAMLIAVDRAERIVVVAVGSGGQRIIRLLADGSPDPTFGLDGAASLPEDERLGELRDLTFTDSGRIRIYHERNLPYLHFGVRTTLDDQGTFLPAESGRVGTGHTGHHFADMPADRVAYSLLPQRGESQPAPFRFGWATGLSGDMRELSLESPGSALIGDLAFQERDGTVVAAGSFSGPVCASRCSDRSSLALVKADADSGELTVGFGDRGIVLIPLPECPHGTAEPLSGGSPPGWARCRMVGPRVAARASLKKPFSRRPALIGRVAFGRPPDQPTFLVQQATIRLPGKLRIRRSKLRSGLHVRPTGDAPGELSASIKGRSIVVTLKDDPENHDLQLGEPHPPNRRLSFTFRLRGALKPIPPRRRNAKMQMRVRARYAPHRGTIGVSYDPHRWFAWSASGVTTRIR